MIVSSKHNSVLDRIWNTGDDQILYSTGQLSCRGVRIGR